MEKSALSQHLVGRHVKCVTFGEEKTGVITKVVGDSKYESGVEIKLDTPTIWGGELYYTAYSSGANLEKYTHLID